MLSQADHGPRCQTQTVAANRIEIDFSRGPVLTPIGTQWANRDAVTAFLREAREALQECAAARGRPIILAVRVADTLPGCHFDGLDVEAW